MSERCADARVIHGLHDDHVAEMLEQVVSHVDRVRRGQADRAESSVAARVADSPALVADGNHARVDGLVSLVVVASVRVTAVGFERGDPLIGLAITLVILRITLQSIQTLRDGPTTAATPTPRR